MDENDTEGEHEGQDLGVYVIESENEDVEMDAASVFFFFSPRWLALNRGCKRCCAYITINTPPWL